MNPNTKKHEFNGEYGWQLRWSESDLGFRLENPNHNVTGSVHNCVQPEIRSFFMNFNSGGFL